MPRSTTTSSAIVQNLSTSGFSILGLGSPVNLVGPDVVDSALHLNNVMLLGASPAQLGYTSTAVTSIKYKVVTCPGTNPGCARSTTGDHCTPAAGTFFDQAAGPFSWDWANQGLSFGGDFLDEDLNGKALPVTWNSANLTANGSLGALLLHHHNGVGKRAEVVLLDTPAGAAPAADLALTKTVDVPAPAAGGAVVFTLIVTNNGPSDATGVVVNDFLPDGLTWLSDDGGGAYNPATGLWTIPGTIVNGASATLHITATADSTEPLVNVAEIGAGSPLDPNPANNRATTAVRAPRSADLHLTFGANVGTANPGQTIVYTLTVTNSGQDPAYSVDVQEAFNPFPGLARVPITVSQGVYDPATGHWDLASLPVGNTATLSFSVTAPSMAGNLVNIAATSSALRPARTKAADPNPIDNTATATVLILSPASIGTRTKTVTGSFQEGGSITYTVTIQNSGTFDQQDNSGDELSDVLPASLTLVSAAATAGTAIANVGTNTVTWNGAITAGGSVTITINALINNGTHGTTITNQGTINFDADGNDTNESTTLTDDPAVGGADDPTSFDVAGIAAVPTLSGLAALFLGLALAGLALMAIRPRN